MAPNSSIFSRKTRETDIRVEIVMEPGTQISIETGVPFFDHLLQAMAFHGRFGLLVEASGDLEVDEHHLVEDTGIVLGEALNRLLEQQGPVQRYGQALIPMDEALSEVVVDVCGRPYLVYDCPFPQERVGSFQLALLREFFNGLASHARISLHARVRYGGNSHHMAESLFKALGIAAGRAYAKAGPEAAGPQGRGRMSTKGRIG